MNACADACIDDRTYTRVCWCDDAVTIRLRCSQEAIIISLLSNRLDGLGAFFSFGLYLHHTPFST